MTRRHGVASLLAGWFTLAWIATGMTGSVLAAPAKKKTSSASTQTAQKSKTKKKTAARKKKASSYWTEPTYADSTAGDNIDGEDLDVRRSAVDALGPLNGTVVVVDPNTGRILTMVNQKLALSSGFQPCSTIKVPVALAALREGIIERTSTMRIAGRGRMDLTEALAHSNNPFFASLGVKLGYERVAFYAHLFGLGEKAGLGIPGEHPGRFPSEPPKDGGVGMLTSFGSEISLTPLQLAAFMATLANGGTLYYLQYPTSDEEAKNLVPRIKRELDIQDLVAEVLPGMRGAVEYGTARRAYDPDDPIAGKTGTCSENRVHLGWFGSFNDAGQNKLVVTVLLTGGKPSVGPLAAQVAGQVYKNLAVKNYFAVNRPITPAALVSTSMCCSR